MEQDSDSGDELDDERLPLFYVRPRFEWTQGEFVSRSSPLHPATRADTRVGHFNDSTSALHYFSLFYSEELFTKIVEYTNRKNQSLR